MKFMEKKRLIAIVAVLVLTVACALVLCSYIAASDIPSDNDADGIEQPSESFIERIKQDYREYCGYEDDRSVDITQYYGAYNGNCVPLVIRQDASFTAVFKQEIAGVSFVFPESASIIIVWADGNFYSLEEAYESGYLTAEQLEDILYDYGTGGYLVIDSPEQETTAQEQETTALYEAEESPACVTEE